MKKTIAVQKSDRSTEWSSQASGDETSATLLQAAREILMTSGLPGLSLRRIAEAAGCTTMQVYSRFQGKDGLLQALFEEGFELLAAAQRAIPLSMPAEKRVQHLCRAYLQIAAEYPQHYALMLGGHSADFTPPKESQERAMATLSHLVEAVANALPSGNEQARLASEVAHQILAFCHGWATLSAIGITDKTNVEAIDRAVSALLFRAGA